jgi:DNA polymerase-3 subunit gamma/tau
VPEPAAAAAATLPAAAVAASQPAVVPDSAGLRRLWPEVLDQVRTRSRRTRALLDNASVASVDGSVIRLGASSAPIAKMIGDERNLTVLRESLAAVVGGGWTVEVTADAGQPAAPSATPRPPEPSPVIDSPPPVDEADEVDEETDVVSDAGGTGGDAEAAAIALLQNGLGARPIERP